MTALKSRLLSGSDLYFRRFHVGVHCQWRFITDMHMQILVAHLTIQIHLLVQCFAAASTLPFTLKTLPVAFDVGSL